MIPKDQKFKLTVLGAALEGVRDLGVHGLAASLERGNHEVLERLTVRRLDWRLEGIPCCST